VGLAKTRLRLGIVLYTNKKEYIVSDTNKKLCRVSHQTPNIKTMTPAPIPSFFTISMNDLIPFASRLCDTKPGIILTKQLIRIMDVVKNHSMNCSMEYISPTGMDVEKFRFYHLKFIRFIITPKSHNVDLSKYGLVNFRIKHENYGDGLLFDITDAPRIPTCILPLSYEWSRNIGDIENALVFRDETSNLVDVFKEVWFHGVNVSPKHRILFDRSLESFSIPPPLSPYYILDSIPRTLMRILVYSLDAFRHGFDLHNNVLLVGDHKHVISYHICR